MCLSLSRTTPLLDILDFYPEAGLTGWEEGRECSIKDVVKGKILKDSKAGGDLGVGATG